MGVFFVTLVTVATALRCHLGGVQEEEVLQKLHFPCSSAGSCLVLVANYLVQHGRPSCEQLQVEDVRFLVAAAYLSTPSTEILGVAEESSLPLRHRSFLPQFLAALPAVSSALLLEQSPLVPMTTRWEAEEGPEASFYSHRCEPCEVIADNIETYLRMLSQTYSSSLGGEVFDQRLHGEVLQNRLQELRFPESVLIHGSLRILPRCLYQLDWLRGKFGVIVGDAEAFYLAMLLAVGVKQKSYLVHFGTQWLGIQSRVQDLSTVRSATPHRAEWIFVPPMVMETVGLDTASGDFHLAADVALMETLSRALATGGRIIMSITVGEDCLLMNSLGQPLRVYGPHLLQQLLERWNVEVQMEHPEVLRVSYGPCRSRPAVLVLRSKWDRHPASLLTVRRIDIIPKLIYALYRRQLPKGFGMQDHTGEWASDVYFNCGISMGALAEHCAFDINIVAEPCRKKFGREEFQKGFDFLMDSLEYLGFTRAISDLRLDQNDLLMNGAHRVAIALAAGLPAVPVTPTALHDGITGGMDQTVMLHNLERHWGLSKGRTLISTLLLELVKWQESPSSSRQLGVVFVWPKAPLNFTSTVEDEIFKKFFLVMPHWDVALSGSGCFNLVQHLYHSHSWAQNMAFVHNKAVEVCGEDYLEQHLSGDLVVFEMQKDELPEVQEVKSMLTAVGGVNAIYVSSQPTAAISTMHRHTLEFLNLAPTTAKKLPVFVQQLPRETQEKCVLGDSALLQIFHIRDARQLEVVCVTKGLLPKDSDIVDYAAEPWVNFYQAAVEDLVYDPSRYFWVHGWRVQTPHELIPFKEARHAKFCTTDRCEFHDDVMEALQLRRLLERWPHHNEPKMDQP